MAEIVLFLAIKKIGIALANEVKDQAGAHFAKYQVQLTELQGRMVRVMSELRVTHEVLCQMDIRNRSNPVYQVWLEEVRKVAYVMEDTVDEYLFLVHQEHELGCCFYLKRLFKQPRDLVSLLNIANVVKETESNLKHLSETKDRWVPMKNNGDASNLIYNIVHKPHDLASISRSLGEVELVGIEDSKKKLVHWLRDEELARSVIVVYGMGGLGKTALAATVYRNEREKFECHAWISISQTYTREDILQRLIEVLIKDQTKDLTKYLEERKYLIVLDDVWTPEVHTDLFGAFPQNFKGSRIMITTRNAHVAHLSFPARALELKRLSDGDSWELFCKKAFLSYECPMELEELSKQIVRKCEGLPLAIVSIGSLLFARDKTREEWKRIHDQLSWELNNNPSMDHVRNVLYLSFIYLPTHLRSCFLYCSLFPEDHLLKRKMLVRWWIAEGFVDRRGASTMEEVAEGYLKELVHMNMLQIVERNSFGRIKSFQMHDIVRELAIDLCRRECFGVAYSVEEDKHGESQEKTARRLVIQKLNDLSQAISSGNHFRSVVALNKSMPSSSSLLPLVADKCRYISVLEISGLAIDKIPDSIGDLFNLQHLGLRGTNVKVLPDSIEKLSNLLTLDLYESELQELPRGIVKLKKLRHLFVERVKDKSRRDFRCCIGVHIPKGLENLMDLETLKSLELQDESMRSLRKLKQMRSITIWNVKGSYCERLYESLHRMEFLSFLSIVAIDKDEALQLSGLNLLPPNLQKLDLRGRLAQGMLGAALGPTGKNLYSLKLYWSQLREDPLPSLSQLSNLTELWLTKAYIGEQLVFLQGWFPNLKDLCLADLSNLKRLEVQQGAMLRLEELRLVNLRAMEEVPSGIEFLMPTLKDLGFLEITRGFLESLSNSRIGDAQWWYSLR